MARSKSYRKDVASFDGQILSVVATNLGNNQTRYTYFDLAREGYNAFTLQHIITATTISIESCNVGADPSQSIKSVCTGTDGTGATIISSTLNTTNGFVTDDDLIGIQVRVTGDSTTPTNVGLIRTVVDYAQATGTMTLDSALGATTNGVTQFELIDNNNAWNRRVSDPTSGQWTDITDLLFGVASETTSGLWMVSVPLCVERLRIKRLTTNATNALSLRLTRGIT